MREEERLHREGEILKELALINKIGSQNFGVVEKHFKKMVRKILVLTLDKGIGMGS